MVREVTGLEGKKAARSSSECDKGGSVHLTGGQE